jgi:hypothetical protein
MKTYKKSRQVRYSKFIQKLTLLSEKYGVAIHSTGEIFIASENQEVFTIEYDCDSSSGDLRNEVFYLSDKEE